MTASVSASLSNRPPSVYRLLDAVRGVASVWVVLFHAALLTSRLEPELQEALVMRVFLRGYLGVQIFFVVSGYCIANAACSVLSQPHPLARYVTARVRRILPPCWASLFFFALAGLLATWLHRQGRLGVTSLVQLNLMSQSFGFFLSNLTLTQILFGQDFLSVVCWTLCYEMAFYAVAGMALLAVLTVKRPAETRVRWMLGLLHGLTLGCGAVLIAAPQMLPYPLDLWAQFGLGVAVFDVLRGPSRRGAQGVLGMMMLLLAAFVALRQMPMGYTREDSRWTYGTAMATAGLLLACHRLDGAAMRLWPVRLAAFVGRFSYSLYLINFLAVSGMVLVARQIAMPGAMRIGQVVVIGVAVLPVAYVFFWFFERPFLKSGEKQRVAVVRKERVRGVEARREGLRTGC